jgi:predicted nucleotidyltransferase
MKFYQINLDHPEIKRFKIDSALEAMQPIVIKLEKIASKIVMFGSASRGEQTAESDFDLLVLTNHKEQVRSIINKMKQAARIKPIVKTPSEWSETEIKEPEFYQEVKRGILLHNYVSRI